MSLRTYYIVWTAIVIGIIAEICVWGLSHHILICPILMLFFVAFASKPKSD